MQKEGTCSICKGPYTHYGHNPEPVLPYEQRCCDGCNASIVVPIRVFGLGAVSSINDLRKLGFKIQVSPKR